MSDTLDVLDVSEMGNNHLPSQKKQAPLRKNHFITWWYTDIKDLDVPLAIMKKMCYKGCGQSEICPTTKRPHIHFQLWGKKQFRDTELKLPNSWNGAMLKDEKNTRDYCAKSESHDGLFRINWGFPKPIKIIDSLYPFQQKILNIFESDPDDRVINWFWEDTGNVGKSSFVKYMVVKHECQFCDGGKKADLVNLVFNTDMDNCKAIIWDIPRSAKGHISYSTLESIKNGLICNTKYETGVKAFNSPHIFVFANFPPDDTTQLSTDRWNIKEIIDKDFD